MSRSPVWPLWTLIGLGCGDPSGPVGSSVWTLETVGGDPLPARVADAGTQVKVVRETLTFGVESDRFQARPLARGDRRIRLTDGTELDEEWFFTYESTGSGLAIHPLCPDNSLASCIDLSGTANVGESTLRIRFNQASGFRELRYGRVVR